MTDSRLLHKYTASRQAPPEEKPADEGESLDNLGVCGLLRGIRDRALMLELRHKDGNVDVFPYAWLSRATFNPSEGFTLRFGSETVKITGRNLGAPIRSNMTLLNALVRHRLAWIQECDEPAALSAPRHAVVIDGISVK